MGVSDKTKRKIGRIYSRIMTKVKCELRFSKFGTPHLVTDDGYSFCYFAGQKRVKLFTNYGDIKNRDMYSCESWEEAVNLYYELSDYEPQDFVVANNVLKFWDHPEYKAKGAKNAQSI